MLSRRLTSLECDITKTSVFEVRLQYNARTSSETTTKIWKKEWNKSPESRIVMERFGTDHVRETPHSPLPLLGYLIAIQAMEEWGWGMVGENGQGDGFKSRRHIPPR